MFLFYSYLPRRVTCQRSCTVIGRIRITICIYTKPGSGTRSDVQFAEKGFLNSAREQIK